MTHEEYLKAMEEIHELVKLDPATDSPEGKRLLELVEGAEAFERERWPEMFSMTQAPNPLLYYGVTDEQFTAFREALNEIPRGVVIPDDWICEHLGITRETLDRMIENGDFLPPIPDA